MAGRNVYFVVGLVIVVALLILLFGVHFLKNTVPGEKNDRYYVVFDKVSTLTLGDPVKLNGVTMGRVKVIEIWNNQVKVGFEIKRSFKDHEGAERPIHIPLDSKIRVQNIGLMGERQIEIQLGGSREVYAPGDVIQNGLFDAGIAEAMGTAGQVFGEAERLVSSMRSVLDSTVGSDDFVPMFRGLMRDATRLSARMHDMLDRLDPRISSSVEHLESASSDLESLLDRQKGPIRLMVDRGTQVARNVDSLVARVDEVTGEITVVLDKLNSREGTLGAMIQDSSFYHELRTTIRNADSLLSLIRKQGLDVNVDIF